MKTFLTALGVIFVAVLIAGVAHINGAHDVVDSICQARGWDRGNVESPAPFVLGEMTCVNDMTVEETLP